MDTFKLVLSIEFSKDSSLEDNLVKVISYGNCGADALLIREKSTNSKEHDDFILNLRALSNECDTAIYVGGYIKKLEDVKKYLYAGAKKVFFTFENAEENKVYNEAIERFGAEKIAFLNSNVVRNEHDIKAFSKIFNARFMDVSIDKAPDIDFLYTFAFDNDAQSLADIAMNNNLNAAVFNAKDINIKDFMNFKFALKIKNIPVSVFDSDMEFSEFKVDENGLIPCVAQDYRTGQVLMVAYMNEEAFNTTINTGMMTYYSRSRNEIWTKGLTSGHLQFAKKLSIDCDKDTILAQVYQVGAACHTGNRSCFYTDIAKKDYMERNPAKILEDVYSVILDRKENPKEGSYTNYLFNEGIDKILKKCGEEATEIVIAAKNPDKEEIKYEISDFLYHMMVLMVEKGVTWTEIMDELANR